jgi:AcrR family transcriptional regulator
LKVKFLKPALERNAVPPKAHIGRPRSEKTRKAILRAAFRLLRRHGFVDIAAQQIAKEARVSTATLYRWWKNKESILLDAYLATARDLLPYGKRGTPAVRLKIYAIRIAEFLNSPDGRVFLRLLLAIQESPALRKAFYEKVFVPRRTEGCNLVKEAVVAGELPPTVDPDLIINLLIASQLLPALLGQHLTAEYAAMVFELVCSNPLKSDD